MFAAFVVSFWSIWSIYVGILLVLPPSLSPTDSSFGVGWSHLLDLHPYLPTTKPADNLTVDTVPGGSGRRNDTQLALLALSSLYPPEEWEYPPLDVVYTWVNGSDPEWIKLRNKNGMVLLAHNTNLINVGC